jgi:hypothetical protein
MNHVAVGGEELTRRLAGQVVPSSWVVGTEFSVGSQDVYFEVGEVFVLNRSDGTIKFGVVKETRTDLGDHVVLVGCSYDGEQIVDLVKTVRVDHIDKLSPMFLQNLTIILQTPDLTGQRLNSGTIMVVNVANGTSTQGIRGNRQRKRGRRTGFQPHTLDIPPVLVGRRRFHVLSDGIVKSLCPQPTVKDPCPCLL